LNAAAFQDEMAAGLELSAKHRAIIAGP